MAGKLIKAKAYEKYKFEKKKKKKKNIKKKKKKKKRETTYLKAKFFKYLEFSIDFLMEIFSCQM